MQAAHEPPAPVRGLTSICASPPHVTQPRVHRKMALGRPGFVPISDAPPPHSPPVAIPNPGVADETTLARTVSMPSALAKSVRYIICPVTYTVSRST